MSGLIVEIMIGVVVKSHGDRLGKYLVVVVVKFVEAKVTWLVLALWLSEATGGSGSSPTGSTSRWAISSRMAS